MAWMASRLQRLAEFSDRNTSWAKCAPAWKRTDGLTFRNKTTSSESLTRGLSAAMTWVFVEGEINQGKRRLITHLLYLFKIQIFNGLPGEKNRKKYFSSHNRSVPDPFVVVGSVLLLCCFVCYFAGSADALYSKQFWVLYVNVVFKKVYLYFISKKTNN